MINILGNINNNYMQENVSIPRYRIGSINSWSKEIFWFCVSSCELSPIASCSHLKKLGMLPLLLLSSRGIYALVHRSLMKLIGNKLR